MRNSPFTLRIPPPLSHSLCPLPFTPHPSSLIAKRSLFLDLVEHMWSKFDYAFLNEVHDPPMFAHALFGLTVSHAMLIISGAMGGHMVCDAVTSK